MRPHLAAGVCRLELLSFAYAAVLCYPLRFHFVKYLLSQLNMIQMRVRLIR